ncbi:MAG: site-2 protease family protein [Fulvivirga sp.]
MEKGTKTLLIQVFLFIATFFTTTMAGEQWIHGKMWLVTDYSWAHFSHGLQYSIPLLMILTVHEFGHYFTARYHKIKTTLPYYIPLPPFLGLIGTMGALIRIKEHVKSKKLHFDIGVAGPVAGFVIALGVLFYGFTHLPEPEYIYEIHPEYEQYGADYADHVYENDSVINMAVGKPLLFLAFEKYVVEDPSRIPNASEMMHYPWLFAGFLALLFTALNLMPIGQLDGGHVLYGLIGYKRHKKVASVIFIAFVFYAGLGYITPYDGVDNLMLSLPLYLAFLYITLKGLQKGKQETFMYALILFTVQFGISAIDPTIQGYSGWLLFAFIVGRFLGIHHPRSPIEEPLDLKRKILGWLALIIFIISFSPTPLIIN